MGLALIDQLECGGRLPTPPAVVLRLLEMTRRADVSMREITDAIALDSGLSAKILRFANSPMAGASRKIPSLHQAVAMMGIRGIKMMALSFAVLAEDGARTCAAFDRDIYAIQSLSCGVAGKVFGSMTGWCPPQEAFSTGLLSQIGRSILATVVPDQYAVVLDRVTDVPRGLPEVEREVLGTTYAEVGGEILRRWGLPEGVWQAVRRFREPGTPGDPLSSLLDLAEQATSIICPGSGANSSMKAFLETTARQLDWSPEQTSELLSGTAREVEELRHLLDMPDRRIRSASEIEGEVRDRIAELSVAMHMENQSLAQQQADLLQRVTTDPLTGIGNRAAFDARLQLELDRSARTGAPLGLLMIDVDHFKRFNDQHGHPAGDRVLQEIARTLDANVRKIDYAVRYGGEEFAVIAPETRTDGLELLAERLRKVVAELSIPWEGQKLRVTISVGGAVLGDAGDDHALSKLIRLADQQLYQAKHRGRNRICCLGGSRAEATTP